MSRTRIELTCLALLAILPLIPYLAFLLDHGAPRYGMQADLALIEHDVRHVWDGETLLGLESRFGWHHPGPLFFYLCAPFERLFRPSSTGLYVGTWFIAAFAAAAPVIATRLHAGRAHAIAVLVVTLAWLAAFGNLAVNPWNRTVVVLPLLGYFAMMALFAHGASGCLLPGVVLGTVVAHTHVASVSTVGAIGAAATIAFVVKARRRGGAPKITRKEWSRLGVTAGALALLFAPLVIEQLGAPSGEGNLTKLYRFARERQEPYLPWVVAIKNWALATSWLPDRIIETSLLREGGVPEPMLWFPVATGVSRTARVLVGLQVALVAGGALLAARRRDTTSMTFLAFGALGVVLAVSALRSIVGEEHNSLIFWSAVPGCVALFGAAAALASALAPAVARWCGRSRGATILLVGIGLVAAMFPTALNRDWQTRNPFAPGSVPSYVSFIRLSSEGIKERSAAARVVPVIHMVGSWWWAAAMVLELEKDGVDVRIAPGDAWWFAGAKTPDDGERALHFYFASVQDPVPTAACLELAGDYGDGLEVYSSERDVSACDEPKALAP